MTLPRTLGRLFIILLATTICNAAESQPAATDPAGFTHPGILHSAADLDRMHDMVQGGIQPWARGFEALQSVPQSSLSYVVQGPFKNVAYEKGQYEFRRDASAAYNLAIMWVCTKDRRYAEKSLGIIRAWAQGMESFDKGDHLTAGMGVNKFAAAAEIFRYQEGSGWTESDTAQFNQFLERMKPAVDKPNLFMNQGGYALLGMTAIAVFTNDAEFYKKTIHRATVGDGRDPQKDPALSKAIWASGQVVEMGRDQTHPQGGIGSLAYMAQTANIQGTKLTGLDLFDYLDRRLLKGYEYLAAHNLGFDRTYQENQEDGKKGFYSKFSPTDRGKLAPIFEVIYQHYKYRSQVPPEALKYTSLVREFLKPEGFSEDFPGFGTLLFSQPESGENTPPSGPPKELVTEKTALLTGRILAADYSASEGVGREYYTDLSGRTELIASNIQAGDNVRYDGVDFGATPVDTFIARAGSASQVGCKIDLRIDDPASEPVAVLQVVNTGWWSTFETFTARLSRPLSGKHTVYLKFYGGNHVYKFQCNLHWFKFAAEASVAAELKEGETANRFPILPAARFGAVVAGSAEKMKSSDGIDVVKMGSGSATLSYPSVEFSSGAKAMALTISGGNGSVIEARSGDARGKMLATFTVPPNGNTKDWQTFVMPLQDADATGHQMIFLNCRVEKTPLQIKSFQLDPTPQSAK